MYADNGTAITINMANTPHTLTKVAARLRRTNDSWATISGCLNSTYPEIMEVKKVFGVEKWKAWKNIYIKALLPGLVTGSVTAIAAEWNASIVAEYFTTTGIGGSGSGVISSVGIGMGKFLDLSLASGNFEMMLLGLLNLTAMILLINTFIWKRVYKRVSDVYK